MKDQAQKTLFLPDFCGIRMVFSVLVIGELLAIILTLAPLKLDQQRWNDLALISLYIQWNALLGSSILCLLRSHFIKFSNNTLAVLSFVTLLLLIIFFSELAYWLVAYLQITNIISSATHWEFLLHNVSIGGIISALALRYFYVQHQWRLKVEAESEVKLQLLQARIRPHFLFNSLNTIASLTRTRPVIAERVTEDLAELLRMIIKEDHNLITLANELALSKRYIAIEKQRLGERLQVSWKLAELPQDAMIPALVLQPLLENAIFHGIEPEIKGGSIDFRGKLEQQQVKITIVNTTGKLDSHRKGNMLAIENIRLRLEAHFPQKASLTTHQREDEFVVQLSFPYQQADEEQG